jgi:ADP-ribosylarginine hydrolase
MRAACIGLMFNKNVEKLIAVAVETGRVTHHNPVGYLGAVVSAYFVYLALNRVEPELWAARLFE